jgi:hypothetical protein
MKQQGFLVGEGRPVRHCGGFAVISAAIFGSHFNSLLVVPRWSGGWNLSERRSVAARRDIEEWAAEG